MDRGEWDVSTHDGVCVVLVGHERDTLFDDVTSGEEDKNELVARLRVVVLREDGRA